LGCSAARRVLLEAGPNQEKEGGQPYSSRASRYLAVLVFHVPWRECHADISGQLQARYRQRVEAVVRRRISRF
jgi:hypothetical protein